MIRLRVDPRRVAGLFLLGAGLVLLWQSWGLEDRSVFGPGPGLFPKVVILLACALAAALVAFPALGDKRADPTPVEDEPALGPAERRSYRAYVASFFVLVVGSATLGFLLTCIAIALVVTWLGERRPLHHALLFGAFCGIVGVIGFGYFIQVELPMSPVDRAIMRWLRSGQ